MVPILGKRQVNLASAQQHEINTWHPPDHARRPIFLRPCCAAAHHVHSLPNRRRSSKGMDSRHVWQCSPFSAAGRAGQSSPLPRCLRAAATDVDLQPGSRAAYSKRVSVHPRGILLATLAAKHLIRQPDCIRTRRAGQHEPAWQCCNDKQVTTQKAFDLADTHTLLLLLGAFWMGSCLACVGWGRCWWCCCC